MVVFVLLVLQACVVSLGLLQTLGIGVAEDVIGQHSLAKARVSGKRLSQLHVLLSILFNYLGLCPLAVLAFDGLAEIISLAEGELVDLFAGLLDCRLSEAKRTSLTVILVLGTPTMSAAVR